MYVDLFSLCGEFAREGSFQYLLLPPTGCDGSSCLKVPDRRASGDELTRSSIGFRG